LFNFNLLKEDDEEDKGSNELKLQSDFNDILSKISSSEVAQQQKKKP